MSESTQYLVFQILLTDAARVATLQGNTTGGVVGAILAAPTEAAITYAAPIVAAHGPAVAPCIVSSWFGGDFPTNVASFDRKSGGWFGWSWLFGDTTHYRWRGEFVYVPPATVPGPAAPPTILPRRWIDGFEFPALGEGGNDGSDALSARVASRHVQGFGAALRGHSLFRAHGTIEWDAGASGFPTTSWERFYLRPRANPATSGTFWSCRGLADNGLVLQHTPSGQIAVYLKDFGALTLVGTTRVLVLDTWVRVDLLIGYAQAALGVAAVPNLRIFLNGVDVLSFTNAAASMAANGGEHHATSTIGMNGANTLALDVDDWLNADYPSVTQLGQGVDFANGSAMVVVSPTGFEGSTDASWLAAGDWRTLLQNPSTYAGTTLAGSGRLAVTTDAADTLDAMPGGLGIAALVVGLRATKADGSDFSATPGTLGYALAGVVETLTPSHAPGLNWATAFWRLTAATVAKRPTTPLTLVHVAAVAEHVTLFGAVAEVLGVFGAEDLPVGAPATVAPLTSFGIHNAPYPRTPWATLTVPPIQPVTVVSGTYVGNGVAQDLAFAVPIHWLWIRPLTGDTGGTRWWSSLLGAHKGHAAGVVANLMVQAGIDAAFVPGAVGATPPSGARVDLVRSVKAALVARGVDLTGACGAFEITKRVAWALRAEGCGLVNKPTGTNCDGYATDTICWPEPGDVVDILGDPGGANTPNWIVDGPTNPTQFHVAIDPADETTGGGTNTQAQQTLLRLVGSDTQNNANGVTYAYVAVGDPGMRFLLNAALADPVGAADRVTTLVHPGFTPLAGFVFPDVVSNDVTAVLRYKGPGHASASLSPLSGAQQANRLRFGLAAVTSQSALHGDLGVGYVSAALSLWRADDGSGHAGAVVQIQSYTGNGTGSRSLALVPSSGKRPLWALVVPHDSAAVQRDASHTGTTSTTLPAAANAATGIIGGDVDLLLLGGALNTDGVVYDVFVIPGSTDACNNGWSCPGIFFPVPPEPPPGAPAPPPHVPGPGAPPDPNPPGGPPVDPPPTPSAIACDAATVGVCNLALSHLGVTKFVVDLATDQTVEAMLARLHYPLELDAVLRAFPWPFATGYATLTRLQGTPTVPVNGDWQYAYRIPPGVLFARRLVGQGGQRRAYDAHPIRFRVGSDVLLGPLLYTDDETGALEYTARPVCAATDGDVLFRTALSWRLAAALAPGLARDDKKTAFCVQMYLRTIAIAETTSANESQQDPPGDPDWITGRN